METQQQGDVVGRLRLSVASLEEKNHRLTRALVTARDQLSGLEGQLAQINRPPASWATFVHADEAHEEVEAIVNGRRMRLAAAPDLDYGTLSPGQLIRLDEKLVVVKGGAFPRYGALASILELVGDDRVLVSSDAGQEHLVFLAGPLRHGSLRPGDTVSVDYRAGFAYERIVRSHVEQLFTPETPDVTYADIGGLDKQIEQIRDAVELPFKYPGLYEEYRLKPPRGILLYGPPGCGKTLVAKAIANSLSEDIGRAETYFISVKGPEILNKYVGETERQIRSIFARARKLARRDVPVVIFFDELEALFRTRGTGISSDVETMIVPQLLAEMDGLESLENVVVIGASNRPDMIDPALLRPGRLDVRVKISRPGRRAGRDIFSKYITTDLPLSPDLLEKKGSPEKAVKYLIESALDRLYVTDSTTELFDLHLASGRDRRVYLADLISGAMIASTVERAKRLAIKDSLVGNTQGLCITHVMGGVEEEIRESSDLASTTTPDEWARTVGLRGEEVLRITPILGEESL